MTATNAATGRTPTHVPLRSALATSRPAIPTYIGLRVTVLGPETTSEVAFEGSNGSTVVPCARNRLAALPASAAEATAVTAAAERRSPDAGGAPRDRPCWTRAAAS